jgi:hypothetical protein
MCFKGTASRISGADFGLLQADAMRMHAHAWPEMSAAGKRPSLGGRGWGAG